jgi:hypothetical protein
MRLVEALTPADKVKRREFCEEMQLKMEENGFRERLIFCDEATFHISGNVNGTISVSREPSNHMHR